MKRALPISLLAVVFGLFFFQKMAAQVVINEFSCSNLDQFIDDHSDFGDWIELYNAEPTAVDISGWYLSDDDDEPTKWQFPLNTQIAAGGLLTVWASGRNQAEAGLPLHANFTLKQVKNKKDHIVLADPSGAIVEDFKISDVTQLGHSWGRVTDGAADWGVFTNPSQGQPNGGTTFRRYAKKPTLNLEAGFYSGPQTIEMTTAEPGATIYFTLNGELPTAASATYSAPIVINETTVLKALVVPAGDSILPGLMRFETYFIDVSHTIPIVSISASDLKTLAEGDKNWFPHGSFEFFSAAGVRTSKSYGEFNSHGQDSWKNDQRSLDFVSRDEMGYAAHIKEKIFTMTDRDEYQRVILRAAGDDNYPANHDSQNAGSAHMRDAYIQNLAKKGGMKLDVREAAKCVVYLNGEYWGIYDLRERPDEHDYIKYNYDQDKYHIQYIQTWGNTWAQYGGPQSITDWKALRTYILNNDMADSAKFSYVTDRLDVTSLADYVLLNGFTVCSDWLNYNTGWWRGLDSTGQHLRWGYTLWDNDATFAFYINYTGIPDTSATALPCDPETLTSGGSDPERHIRVLNRLLKNPGFKNWYNNRQVDLSNSVFSCENMLHQLDSIIAVLAPEMPLHAARWDGTFEEWQENAARMRDFIVRRCEAWPQGMVDCYSLTGPFDVTFTEEGIGTGTLQLNTLKINQLPWTGQFFGNLETHLTAIPDSSFTFEKWTATNPNFLPNTTDQAVKITFLGADTIVAHFSKVSAIGEPTAGLTEPTLYAWPTVFSSETDIRFELPEAAQVSMKLRSMNGQEVATLIQPSQKMSAGEYSVKLNLAATRLPAGLYVIEFLAAGSKPIALKIVYQP